MHLPMRWPHEPRILMFTDSDEHFILEDEHFILEEEDEEVAYERRSRDDLATGPRP